MAPKEIDIGWEHGKPLGNDKRKVVCNYCGKVVHGGITRLKEHIGGVRGNVESCKKAPIEITRFLNQHLKDKRQARALKEKQKQQLVNSLRDEHYYDRVDVDLVDEDEDDDDGGGRYGYEDLTELEMRQMRRAMRESRDEAMQEDRRRHSISTGVGPSKFSSGTTSRPPAPQFSRPPKRSFSVKEGVGLPAKGIDPFMFKSKSVQKTVKGMFSAENVKKVGKAISKFFYYNAIPFNAADSGPYYQGMIDTIAEAGRGVKGPSGYQIGNIYLDEEEEEIDTYIGTLKEKWPQYGCTIMCDGWTSRNKFPIINFMIYCDRNMIYHSSVDTTGRTKTAEYIFSLMDKVVEEVGEENVVQIVTDNEANFKAAGHKLMEKRKHLFWSPCAAHCIDLMLEDFGKMKAIKETLEMAKEVTSFIYNSGKVVNLMKEYTNGRDLLRPGITRFATEFIAIESLIRYQQDLKRVCTSVEWIEYNREKGRRKMAAKVSDLILQDKFWRKAGEVATVMEPLVRVLKIVDQDKKPTLSIIYEAMDRAKQAIKATVKKNWRVYWDIIDNRWETQLHRHLHAAAYFLNPVFQYSKAFSDHPEVRLGLKEVIKRLEPSLEKQAKAMNEIKLFVDARGEFGSALTKKAITQSLPGFEAFK